MAVLNWGAGTGCSADAGATGTGVNGAGAGFSAATGVGAARSFAGAFSAGAASITDSTTPSVAGATISAWAEPSAGTQHCGVAIEMISSGAAQGLQAAGGHWTTAWRGPWQAGRGRKQATVRQRGRHRLRRNRQAEAESIDTSSARTPTNKTRSQRRTGSPRREGNRSQGSKASLRRYAINGSHANYTASSQQTAAIPQAAQAAQPL